MEIKNKIRPLIACSLFGLGLGQASATIITATNNTPGVVDASVAERIVNFATDISVTDVNISIQFSKCGSSADINGCIGDSGSTPFFTEIFFGLKDPTGLIDIALIPFNTWNSGTGDFEGTFTLDDAAASFANINPDRPQNGTFRPINALSAFNGVSSLGNWTLSFSDSAGGDPLVLRSFTLELSDGISVVPPVPEPATYGLVLLGLLGLGGLSYRRKNGLQI